MGLRKRITVVTAAVLAASAFALPSVQARVADKYVGPHFGDGNIPAGCVKDISPANRTNRCFHARVGLNGLDTPSIDVAVLVPASPTAERDRRIMKQTVEMWEGGIDYLAGQMGMTWLRDGVDFNINIDEVVTNPDGSLAAPLKLVDPEIVVLATNPVGGIGIGVDPTLATNALGITDADGLPCLTQAQPFSMEAWRDTAGMDDHHGDAGGVYVERCGETGGNICFAINGAIDPVPGYTDIFGIVDLISHEFGHCLSLGHVGDGADGVWGPVPTNDIMSYSTDPPGISKCVSTLNVEGFATRMSRYIDVNGDGQVTVADRLQPNDVTGFGGYPQQVQDPRDHWYASATGEALDCPQVDVGAIPGATPDWSPTPVATTKRALSVPTVKVTKTGGLRVQGAALRVPVNQPTATSGAVTDAAGDALVPTTDVLGLSAKVTSTSVDAVMKVDQLAPIGIQGDAVGYAFQISDRRFDSYLNDDGTVIVKDSGTGSVMPAGSAVYDSTANTITWHISRSYLANRFTYAPYKLAAVTGVHAGVAAAGKDDYWLTTEDRGPDTGWLALNGPKLVASSADAGPPSVPITEELPVSIVTKDVVLEREGGNTFTPTDSNGAVSPVTNEHVFTLPIDSPAKVKITLSWDDSSDLELHVSGGATGDAATGSNPEVVDVGMVDKDLTIKVDPYLVVGAPQTTYRLVATIEEPETEIVDVNADTDRDTLPDARDRCPTAAGPVTSDGCPDTDRDTIVDTVDRCPKVAGAGLSGCPVAGGERIVVLVDGKKVRSLSMDTRHGRYDFGSLSRLTRGRHTVKIVWYAGGKAVASVTRQVRR